MHKCYILLSIYKPNYKYLNEQLESLLLQSGVVITLAVRVDCEVISSDLRELILQKFPGAKIYYGQNVGPGKSFLTLLNLVEVKKNFFYFFCDQDDYWLPHKLAQHCDAMVKSDATPQVTCSSVLFTDEALIVRGRSSLPKNISFENALSENIIFGCTLGMNSIVLTHLAGKLPEYLNMHDGWIYLYASSQSCLTFLDEPTVLYRQHQGNVIGQTTLRSTVKSALNFLKNFNSNKQREYHQIRDFKALFIDHLTPEQQSLLTIYLNAKHSLYSRFIIAFKCRRNGLFPQLVYLVKILSGRI